MDCYSFLKLSLEFCCFILIADHNRKSSGKIIEITNYRLYLIYHSRYVCNGRIKLFLICTEYIKNFIANNKDFFDTFDKFKEVLDTMVQYTQVQAECYKDLRREILNLRKDYKDAQMESIDLHKSMLKAIDSMTKALDEIRK